MTGPLPQHAILGASGAPRWMNCPGSVNLAEQIDYKDTGTGFAREGSAAHAVAEKCLLDGQDALFYVGQKYEGCKVTDEMAVAVQVYVDRVRMVAKSCGTVIDHHHVETQFSLKELTPPSPMFGTVDYWDWEPSMKHLWVLDYKHGQGVAVEATENAQLMYYALGAAIHLGLKPNRITVVIVQPRCAHEDGIVRDYTFDYDRLTRFAQELLEAAFATTEPDAPLVMSEGACRWCKARAFCPLQKDNAVLVAQSEFDVIEGKQSLPIPESLSEEEVLLVLDKADFVLGWLSAVKKFAKDCMEAGDEVEGWKLVKKRGNRKWIDDTAVLKVLQAMEGMDMDDFVTVISPAQVEMKLRRYGNELPEGLTHNAPSSPGLNMVRESAAGVAVIPEAEFETIPTEEKET